MKDLQSHFNQQLTRRSGHVSRWVIGLSGGLDSVVLLHLAARSIPVEQLLVVNIDHQLQASSAQWSAFCRGLADTLNLPFISQKVVVDGASSLERAARQARYRAFEAILQPDDCLLLAHHQDDQAETMLFRLLRGAGVRGLSGIPERRLLGRAELFRPLLSVPRQQLLAWAQTEQLAWIEDPSNADLSYDRNYLRHAVLPLLQARWPGFTRRWADTARYMNDADQLHRELAEIDIVSVTKEGGLCCQALLGLTELRRNNLLRFWLRQAGIAAGERQILGVLELMSAADDRQPVVHLPGAQLRRYRGVLLLQPEVAVVEWNHRPLTPAGEVTAQGCLVVDSDSAAVGLRTLSGVTLRNRRDGDRCKPVGRGGSRSLKKIFQEHQVPAWQRTSWPVCVVGDEIVAVPGICICEGWQSEKKGDGFTLNWQPIALSARGDSGTL